MSQEAKFPGLGKVGKVLGGMQLYIQQTFSWEEWEADGRVTLSLARLS